LGGRGGRFTTFDSVIDKCARKSVARGRGCSKEGNRREFERYRKTKKQWKWYHLVIHVSMYGRGLRLWSLGRTVRKISIKDLKKRFLCFTTPM
jgi:hypothetical protein